MVSSFKAVFLAAPLLSLLFSTIVNTSPLDLPAEADNVLLILKRQGSDPSGVAPEDETAAEIAADGTGPLRKGMELRLSQSQVKLTSRKLSTLDLFILLNPLQHGTKST